MTDRRPLGIGAVRASCESGRSHPQECLFA
ncbi:hypothetical protein SUDANB126_07015 [Streptomyces sp. enrichment culture]